MILIITVAVGLIFAASVYLLLGAELKEMCMGIFLMSHAANLAILSVSGTPAGKLPPILVDGVPIERYADPLPQALILTAIVIGFAVQAVLLTLLVATQRRVGTLSTDEKGGA